MYSYRRICCCLNLTRTDSISDAKQNMYYSIFQSVYVHVQSYPMSVHILVFLKVLIIVRILEPFFIYQDWKYQCNCPAQILVVLHECFSMLPRYYALVRTTSLQNYCKYISTYILHTRTSIVGFNFSWLSFVHFAITMQLSSKERFLRFTECIMDHIFRSRIIKFYLICTCTRVRAYNSNNFSFVDWNTKS